MYRLSYKALSILLFLVFRISGVTPQCNNGVRCSDSVQHSLTELYALKISEYHYSTLKPTSLTVKVYMTSRPGIDTPGPSWYKLQAISDRTNKPTGEFEEPLKITEAYLGNNNATIEFSTNEPSALLDLPRNYQWSKTAGNGGRICFKLSVLADEAGDIRCRQTVKCILPQGAISEASGSGDMAGYEEFAPSVVEAKSDPTNELKPTTEPTEASIPQKCKNNCTNAKQGEFCSLPEDRTVYSSRCEWRNQKCILRARGVDVEHLEAGKCSTENFPCYNDQKLYREQGIAWIPRCTCKGMYKFIQCVSDPETHEIRCWCSTLGGAQDGLDIFPSEDSDLTSHCLPGYKRL